MRTILVSAQYLPSYQAMLIRLVSIIFAILLSSGLSAQETAAPPPSADTTIPFLTATILKSSSTNISLMYWRYYAGDDSTKHELWKSPTFDDHSWALIKSSSRDLKKKDEQNWKGIGWFRFRFQVDSAAYEQLLCLDIGHRGASEVYVDGKRIGGYGRVSAVRKEEETMRPYGHNSLMPFALTKTPDDVHSIAVRYSDTWAWERHQRFFASRSILGFDLTVATNRYLTKEENSRERWYAYMAFLVGGMAILCLLHVNLLVFSGGREHLLYSLFTGGVAIFFGVRVAEKFLQNHVEALTWLLGYNQYVIVSAFIACVGFFYAVFSTKRPIGIWIIGFLPAVLFTATDFIPFLRENNWPFLLFLGIAFADIMRIIIRAIFRKQKGAWILGGGGICYIVLLGAQLLSENGFIRLPWEEFSGLMFVLTFFSIPVAMSVFLSQKIAATNKELAAKLGEVEHLTEKTIAQEVERKVLQADNDRKTQELEEARKLQLSMLPQAMPEVQGLDIAMFMQTATEVGGDYYDYFTASDGTLTIAIGDATGHGVKAGTMVAATKSLLAVIAQDEKISGPAGVLKPTSPILKRMNLRSMFMALAVARIKHEPGGGVRILLANAGMPSALVFRARHGIVEEVLMKSMPLGTMANFPYEDREITLARGDVLIMMSDGFPERFNDNNDILGYDVAQSACAKLDSMTAQDIIQHCMRIAEEWANGAPLNDDMTFVVVRVL